MYMDTSFLKTHGVVEPLQALCRIGSEFHRRGWSLGTSSNYSVLLSREPFQLLITASGKDKGALGETDFVIVDQKGDLIAAADASAKPSAETLLHVVAAGQRRIGAVLHTHSVWSTLLSDYFHDEGGLWIDGYEMLKGLEGIRTHEHREWVKIFENTQDIASLSAEVNLLLKNEPRTLHYGFLLRRHGLYTFGKDLAEARRHIEIFEFLFEVVGRSLMLKRGG